MSATRTINGWTVTAYPQGAVFKVIAIRGEGKNKVALHVEKLNAEQVKSFDPVARWGGRLAPTTLAPEIKEILV
jgi:hypothetical protein